MSQRKSVLVLFALCSVLATACGGGPEDPAERIDQIRSGYEASLNGFVIEQQPMTDGAGVMPVDEAAEEGAVQEDTAGAAGADGTMAGQDEAEAAAVVPIRQDAVLDILMSLDRRETLPGITVDIEHAGPEPDRAVKEVYHAYLDTSGIRQGGGTQLSYRVEDVDYQAGDAFYVEVRYPIPASERGEYREFQEAGDGRP